MVSRFLSILLCVLCGVLLPAVWANYCSAFIGSNGYRHDAQQCGSQYCCGNCFQMYCCRDSTYRLTEREQQSCSDSSHNDKKNKLGTLLGSILGSIFPILLCVGLVICCCAPCCLFYKKCRKGGRTTNAPVVIGQNSPSGPHPPNPGYQPVPVQPGHGGRPMPPPSYYDGHPSGPSAGFGPGQPMYPLPNQPYGQPTHPGGFAQPPYNPSYQ
uniref:protein shisa-4-like n=1 Tax=Semicossyphus pulcher TaxID=241346 RepID=UPI0037E76525